MTLIHNMTSRIPDFIKNSHLEPTDGTFYRTLALYLWAYIVHSMERVLVSHLSRSDVAMSKPVS